MGNRAHAQGIGHRAQVAGHRAKGLNMHAYTYILITIELCINLLMYVYTHVLM
jgi:hypothetical protein